MAKIDAWTERDALGKIEIWAAECTDAELAGRMGITRSTLARWKKDNSDISDAISRGRTDARACVEVEETLFRRATGYTVPVKKAMKVKTVQYDETTGRRISETEEIVEAIEEQHVPADVGAIRFYLTNRAPERWKNKVEMEGGIQGETFEDYLERREKEGKGANY